eukprot:COSAG01_NODE_3928_length_5526_cov_8.623803_7_plen_152_part_00
MDATAKWYGIYRPGWQQQRRAQTAPREGASPPRLLPSPHHAEGMEGPGSGGGAGAGAGFAAAAAAAPPSMKAFVRRQQETLELYRDRQQQRLAAATPDFTPRLNDHYGSGLGHQAPPQLTMHRGARSSVSWLGSRPAPPPPFRKLCLVSSC